MSEKTITMHQLLAELKTYDDRIKSAMDSVIFIAVHKKKEPEEDIAKSVDQIKSSYDSITHLLDNKAVLEQARINSNNVTKLMIGDKEYTVAEAIKRKHDIEYEERLLNEMVRQFNRATSDYNNKKESVDTQKRTYAINNCGATSSTDIPNFTDKIKELEDRYEAENAPVLEDPIKLEEKIKKLGDEIQAFKINVDAALSVSNALTTVTVNLKD